MAEMSALRRWWKMPKKIISAFAEEWYPVYVLADTTPECAFEVEAKTLARWRAAFTAFERAQEEIKAAQKTMRDMR